MDEIWAIIPAAGSGKRMQSHRPKQFMEIEGQSILELSIKRLFSHPKVSACVVAVPDNDHRIGSYSQHGISYVAGGRERADSVAKALEHVPETVEWVMVHDAARPCVPEHDLSLLVASRAQYPQGCLLASPVRDTIKKSDNKGHVEGTIDRSTLWHALTPQLFPRKSLVQALEYCQKSGIIVTDESSAMEACGEQPGLVEGSPRNIKITWPGDLELAAWILDSE
ncbi:MAG: 2-C-methyl-D-erythritol 4-phosphate cytidylyltransferase [bacterium]